jgi:hypothetical protein
MTAKLFFSSCFDDPLHERLQIRDWVMALNPPFDRREAGAAERLPIWMAENFKVLDRDAPTPALDKAIFCVEGVRDSEVYVAVARSRHGSGVNVAPHHQAQSSYFELEIYEAALLRKPMHIFLLAGAEPDPRLAALLKLVAPTLPGFCQTPLSEREIFGRVEDILHKQSRPKLMRSILDTAQSGARLVNRLTQARFRAYDPARELPVLRFLNGMADASIPRPDREFVGQIIEQADIEPNHNSKLVLLWMAIRELMGAPIETTDDKALLDLWERALSSWGSAGAWFGLHGHPYMGCLASIGSLAQVRAKSMGPNGTPHGAFASEYYSIAKRVTAWSLRRSVLEVSRRHADMLFSGMATSGAYNLRGSIKRAQGDRAGALADYESALDLRRGSEHATDAQIGESMSELGFAIVMAGGVHKGIAHLEEGVALLRRAPASGFLIRAMRKLGRGYMLAGSPISAVRTLDEAYRIASDQQLLDQIGTLDRFASGLARIVRM